MDIQKNKKNIKSDSPELTKIKEELEKAKKESEDYKNKYLRALADYQNYEKRVSEEKAVLRQNANKELLLKLIMVLDDLEKAQTFVKDEGLKLIRDKFINIIKEEGVEEMQLAGKQFDPHLSEAIEVAEGDKDNLIKEVLRKGYSYNGKILRVAQVRVSKKSEARNSKSETNPNL